MTWWFTYTTSLDLTGSKAFGVLELQLAPGGYSWKYVKLDGTVADSGGPVSCHG
jgi:hypothetical protein